MKAGMQSMHTVLKLVQLRWTGHVIRMPYVRLIAITAAGVVPCGGPKKSPRSSSIVQIIFFF